MAANQTGEEPANSKKDSGMAVAIVLPSLFAIILVLLLTVTFVLPRITKPQRNALREEQKKKRMARLEERVRARPLLDWAVEQGDEQQAAPFASPMCVICLDEIEGNAQIRPLGCRHVFHQACLDDWFARWNEFCPLCHRPIIPGMRGGRKKPEIPPALGLLV